MNTGTATLLDFHARHHDEESLVLAVIVETGGSTYRKPGAMMLISPNGDYEGLISGGCLEGDLLEHANAVFQTGDAARVTYDMGSDEDLLWGLGIGCDGMIRLLLGRLDRDHHQALFDGIRNSHTRRRAVGLAVVVTSTDDHLQAGALAAASAQDWALGDKRLIESIREWTDVAPPSKRSESIELDGMEVVLVRLPPPPRVLLCGAGPDAAPVASQIIDLGWECLVTDHRAAFARAERFANGVELLCCGADGLSQAVDLNEIDAAVIMSHHLERDATYLRQLAPLAVAGSLQYLGVLGPRARRDRLAEMADCQRLLIHGPVGLDIGAELPEAIALSVAAEIHAVLSQRDGQSLTTGPRGDGA